VVWQTAGLNRNPAAAALLAGAIGDLGERLLEASHLAEAFKSEGEYRTEQQG